MKEFIIRIQKAELNNFKNVEHGEFNLVSNTQQDSLEYSNILGIYGQNGSGKTTFICALSILESLLSGKRLPQDIINYIMTGKNDSCFVFEFNMKNGSSYYKAVYEFTLQKRDPANIDKEDQDQNQVIVSHEKLSYSILENGKWSKHKSIIDYCYNSEEVFSPKVRFNEITKRKQDVINDLRVAKKYAIKQSMSFIFIKDTYKIIMENCSNEVLKDIVGALVFYGKSNLYIIDNRKMALINADIALPFAFRIKGEDSLSIGSIPIQLNESSTIPENVFEIINSVIKTMNTVLCKIVPGLCVELVNLGKRLMEDGKTGINVELVSIKNNMRVPLKYESEGIKKIISVLHMLIAMYNNPSMTLAIDELDSGIFEYLLGEILKIVEGTGKGQLIFTSHNLRPLETLNKKSIIFTTANPKNRYMRLTNVKTNNNLRDFYYHDIVLGGQKECIYEPTNSFAIARAFRMAGDALE